MKKNTPKKAGVGHVLVLHNIRSAHNVGAIFRTADAVGISKIYLTGVTPTPKDRFGRKRPDIAKAALGAEMYVPWEYHSRTTALLQKLRADNFLLVGVEQTPRAVDFRKAKIKKPAVFVFGNEVRGLNPEVLKKCDLIVEMPMRGKKESLNVAVAAGIILYTFL